jgi:hypothetical protein
MESDRPRSQNEILAAALRLIRLHRRMKPAEVADAMGMAKQSFLMVGVKLLVLTIPAAILGAHLWGVAGIFGAMALVNVVSGIGFHLYNRKLMLQHEGMALASAGTPTRAQGT